ncbi:MAG: metalloregulator ArsR/SmtB family transcription factor [Rhizobiaceae bacterium]
MNLQISSDIFSALGNAKRIQIVAWLRDPEAHFPAQIDGDLVKDGVCAGAICRKLEVSQPSVTAHMKILIAADLVRATRIKQWAFYQLNQETLKRVEAFVAELSCD